MRSSLQHMRSSSDVFFCINIVCYIHHKLNDFIEACLLSMILTKSVICTTLSLRVPYLFVYFNCKC